MPATDGSFLRKNAFLVAAAVLPVLVVAFFLVATAIPQWTVPPPAYDLVLRVTKPYTQPRAQVAVQFKVRDGRLEAVVQRTALESYEPPWSLFVFDHQTMNLTEVPVNVPDSIPADSPSQTIVVDAFANRRIVDQAKAPDGYELRRDGYGNSGLVGDLFGMRRYDRRATIVNSGRVIKIPLPADYQYVSAIDAIGWLVDTAQP